MSSSAILDAIAPHFKSDPDADTFLNLAAGQMGAAAWGSLFAQGAAYLAAHLMTLRDRAVAAGNLGVGAAGGGSGAVSSMSEGGLSISWAGVGSGSGSTEEEELKSTSFGARFIALQAKLVTTPVVAGENL